MVSHGPWLQALVRHGVAASAEHLRALGALRINTVVDVGANVGQFSLLARRLYPAARIVAFEPLPTSAATFKRVFAGDDRVVLHSCAVGKERGIATMHISAALDSSSLLPIGSAQVRHFPQTAEAGTALVQVQRLDDVLNEDDLLDTALLKLDVQGFELPALEGCERLVHRFAYVYFECSFVELYDGQALIDEILH